MIVEQLSRKVQIACTSERTLNIALPKKVDPGLRGGSLPVRYVSSLLWGTYTEWHP